MTKRESQLVLKALAEMRANGFGNYIPRCIVPILDKFDYTPVHRPRIVNCDGRVLQEHVETPSELR